VSNRRRSSSRSKSARTASRRCFRARLRRHSSSRRARREIHRPPPPLLLQGAARGNASHRHPQRKGSRSRSRRRAHRCLLRPLLRQLNAPRSRRIRPNMTTRSTQRRKRETVTLRFFPLVHHNRLVAPLRCTALAFLRMENPQFLFLADFRKRMKHVDRRLPSQRRRKRKVTSLPLLPLPPPPHRRDRSSRSSSK
jgi:hypothetical protein